MGAEQPGGVVLDEESGGTAEGVPSGYAPGVTAARDGSEPADASLPSAPAGPVGDTSPSPSPGLLADPVLLAEVLRASVTRDGRPLGELEAEDLALEVALLHEDPVFRARLAGVLERSAPLLAALRAAPPAPGLPGGG